MSTVKQVLKTIGLILLSLIAIIAVIANPALLFFLVLGIIIYLTLRHFKKIHDFTASNLPLKEYIEQENERKRIEAAKPKPEPRNFTLDSHNSQPLTQHETETWNSFVNTWDTEQK